MGAPLFTEAGYPGNGSPVLGRSSGTDQLRLALLVPAELKDNSLDRLAHCVENIPDAWLQGTDGERKRLAEALFEDTLLEDRKIVAVKPRPELEPFFKLNLECHSKDIAGDPDGVRESRPELGKECGRNSRRGVAMGDEVSHETVSREPGIPRSRLRCPDGRRLETCIDHSCTRVRLASLARPCAFHLQDS
jgi:hypothetical protein